MTLALAKKRSPDGARKQTNIIAHRVPTSSNNVHSIPPAPIIQRKPNCPCGGGCPSCKNNLKIRPTLKINQPGDIYEQEADRVAEQVMKMPDPSTTDKTKVSGQTQFPHIHLICTGYEEELRRQPMEEDEELLQTKKVSGGTREISPGVESQIKSIRGRGQPLSQSMRDFIEPRFGQDFSKVRIHTDSNAGESAKAVNALAYTVGEDVVFGAGRYSPDTESGKGLIAHELTHVLQQGSVGRVVQRQLADDPGEIQSYVFAGEKRLATDKNFARQSGQEIAARIRKGGKLTRDLRLELNGMLSFFRDEAKEAYIQEIKPALVQVTTSTEPDPTTTDPTAFFNRMATDPNYIDNNIAKVEFFTAEVARIHYRDGLSFELGLVPKWMKPPFVEVDYHTPRDDLRPIHEPKKGVSFLLESELQNVPRSMLWAEVQKRYARPVEFLVGPGLGGRIVPSRVNMLTAPTLCKVLLDSERRFVEQVQWGREWGTGVAGVVGAMGGGGMGEKAAAPLVKRDVAKLATRQAMSPAARKLAGEMDNLLKTGATKTITVEGMEFVRVEVARQGSRLAVRRFQSKLPHALRGKGLGTRMVAEFEEAAVATARANGLKTVTIDVGIITNPGWREILRARGYVWTSAEGGWIKTIKL